MSMSKSDITLACIGGKYANEMLANSTWQGYRMGSMKTPFGYSQPIYRCSAENKSYYLLLRHSDGKIPIASSFTNHRANIYALKDLGVTHIISWSGARAVTHNYFVGQLVLADDLIDETRLRIGTFFEHGALVDIRQWPVFCPTLRNTLSGILSQMGIKFSQAGTYLCSEGPRRETRAEVRKYAQWGADLVGHSLAPEAFLARELQLCYASICFISDFAETGSEHRPFTAGGLFKDINVQPSEKQARESLSLMPGIISKLLDSFDGAPSECSCHKNMADLIASGSLSKDFHEWFESLRPISTKSSIEKTSKIPLPAVSPSVLKTPSANRV